MKTLNNVTDIVVASDMCVGCGVCSAICPSGCLRMQMTRGEYKPILVAECLPKCDVCLQTCPFFNHAANQDMIARELFEQQPDVRYHAALGYYLESYLAHSNVDGHRKNGSSGGMVTWLLERLFLGGEIDRVVAVEPSIGGQNGLFQMAILNDVAEIRQAASSRYYPVQVSAVLRRIWKSPEEYRYALVGLPCVLYGVRRAMLKKGRLRRRVSFLIGLVCGYCPNAQYTEFLCSCVGIRKSAVQMVGYRFKEGTDRSSNFRFRAMRHDGAWSDPLEFDGMPGHVWNRRYFAHNACNYCDDVFAEVADIVCMDAWLPQLYPETQGTSIIIVRDSRLNALLRQGYLEESCYLAPCRVEDVIESQEHLVRDKKEAIAVRLAIARQEQKWVPDRRVPPAEGVSKEQAEVVRCRAWTIALSKQLWPVLCWLPLRVLPGIFIGTVDAFAILQSKGALTLTNILRKIVKAVLPYGLIVWRQHRRQKRQHSWGAPVPGQMGAQSDKLAQILSRIEELNGEAKLNIGCGPDVREGWINADLSDYGDICIDARLPLPFPDASFRYIFSEHFIEHLDKTNAIQFFRECLRILVPGGRIRFTTPDLSVLAAEVTHPTDISNALLETFLEMKAIVNEGHRIDSAAVFNCAVYGHGHRYMWTFEHLADVLRSIGFVHPVRCEFGKSSAAGLAVERRAYSARWILIIEAEKPSSGFNPVLHSAKARGS